MNDTTIITLCFSGAAVFGGIALLIQGLRKADRLAKMAEADKEKMESVYAQIHLNANVRQTGKSDTMIAYADAYPDAYRNTLGRGAGSGEKRAADAGDSAAPHIINVQPRISRACAPTERLIDRKGEK